MYISAKVDYATRVLLVLAAAPAGTSLRGSVLAERQDLPVKFVENTLLDLRRAGIVTSQRGADGGYRLARPAKEIHLAEVHGLRPDQRSYQGDAEHLQEVWVAVRAALRSVLETVTLADVVAGKLPRSVAKLVAEPDAWAPRALR